MTFETLVKAAERHEKAGDAWMVACFALDALRALAVERAAARIEGAIETLRGPVSYSHWGMH